MLIWADTVFKQTRYKWVMASGRSLTVFSQIFRKIGQNAGLPVALNCRCAVSYGT
jgi:hypothetical protein